MQIEAEKKLDCIITKLEIMENNMSVLTEIEKKAAADLKTLEAKIDTLYTDLKKMLSNQRAPAPIPAGLAGLAGPANDTITDPQVVGHTLPPAGVTGL